METRDSAQTSVSDDRIHENKPGTTGHLLHNKTAGTARRRSGGRRSSAAAGGRSSAAARGRSSVIASKATEYI